MTRTLRIAAHVAAAVALIVLWPALVHAQSATAELPRYEDRRFEEDWSVLGKGTANRRRDPWDRVKFIPLDSDDRVWLTLAGQVRGREEYFSDFQFGDSQPKATDAYFLSRVRLSADLHVGKHFRVFAEAKSSLAASRDLEGGDNASFVDSIDLQNGFVDVSLPWKSGSATVRAGRQELLFGAQRLVGPSDWTNIRRTFQGFSGIVRAGDWSVTPFWSELVVVSTHGFDNGSPDRTLYGAYGSGEIARGVHADAYWLGANNASASFNGTRGRERRQTFGGRIWQAPRHGQADFDVEAAAQMGSVGGEDVRAWMTSANAAYTFERRLSPRAFATFDYASGDGTPGGKVGTFNQLYPTNHTYLGNIDIVGRQNIVSPSAGLTVQPVSRLSVVATQYFFWRASRQDGLYDSSGSLQRAGTLNGERYVGAETDLVATFNIDRHVLCYAGYNHFFPGAFVRQSGPSRAIDYVYGALQFTF